MLGKHFTKSFIKKMVLNRIHEPLLQPFISVLKIKRKFKKKDKCLMKSVTLICGHNSLNHHNYTIIGTIP